MATFPWFPTQPSTYEWGDPIPTHELHRGHLYEVTPVRAFEPAEEFRKNLIHTPDPEEGEDPLLVSARGERNLLCALRGHNQAVQAARGAASGVTAATAQATSAAASEKAALAALAADDVVVDPLKQAEQSTLQTLLTVTVVAGGCLLLAYLAQSETAYPRHKLPRYAGGNRKSVRGVSYRKQRRTR